MSIGFMESVADLTIAFLAFWAAILFWRIYQNSEQVKNLFLAVVFGFIGAFKLTQFILDVLLGLELFAWMDSVLAGEVLVIILTFSVIVVLSGSRLQRPRTSDKPKTKRSAA